MYSCIKIFAPGSPVLIVYYSVKMLLLDFSTGLEGSNKLRFINAPIAVNALLLLTRAG